MEGASSNRFALPVSDELEQQRRGNAIPGNTKAATSWGVGIFSEWASKRIVKAASIPGIRSLETPLLEMEREEIAYWMGKFVLEIRKQNGSEYPPKTLYQIVCCFKRHFEANGIHNVNILSSQEPIFGNFRRTLDAEIASFRPWSSTKTS